MSNLSPSPSERRLEDALNPGLDPGDDFDPGEQDRRRLRADVYSARMEAVEGRVVALDLHERLVLEFPCDGSCRLVELTEGIGERCNRSRQGFEDDPGPANLLAAFRLAEPREDGVRGGVVAECEDGLLHFLDLVASQVERVGSGRRLFLGGKGGPQLGEEFGNHPGLVPIDDRME